jgi:hypothetical protein
VQYAHRHRKHILSERPIELFKIRALFICIKHIQAYRQHFSHLLLILYHNYVAFQLFRRFQRSVQNCHSAQNSCAFFAVFYKFSRSVFTATIFLTRLPLLYLARQLNGKAVQKEMPCFVQVYDFSKPSHIPYRYAVNMVEQPKWSDENEKAFQCYTCRSLAHRLRKRTERGAERK